MTLPTTESIAHQLHAKIELHRDLDGPEIETFGLDEAEVGDFGSKLPYNLDELDEIWRLGNALKDGMSQLSPS